MFKAIESSLLSAKEKLRRGGGAMVLQESGEMYLETIYVLSQKKDYVRSIDVGEELNFSRPSVSRAIHILKEGGFLTIGQGGALRLTDMGREYAEKIYERHTILTKCFVALGVDQDVAVNDACRIEHVISDECFAALKRHFNAMGENAGQAVTAG
jgi:Mn-dependent DtxR family transcriptional regulator